MAPAGQLTRVWLRSSVRREYCVALRLRNEQLSVSWRSNEFAVSVAGLQKAPQAKVTWPRFTSLEDIATRVADIHVPTMVIAGELDRVDPPIRLQAEMFTRIPQAVMHVLPGGGHSSMLESPDAVAGLIADFSRGLTISNA